MFKTPPIAVLVPFLIVLTITAPIRAFKDTLYPHFNPQEWPFISSRGFLNRFLAGHCFEIFLITFIILNSFKYWLVRSKSPILPTREDQLGNENNRDNQHNNHEDYYETLKNSKSDLYLLKQIESLELSVATSSKYIYMEGIKLMFIYLPLSMLIIWFFGPSIYEKIHYSTGGYCSNHPEFKYYQECVRNGYKYLGGFKSSGHSLITTTFASCLLFEIISLNTWVNYINFVNKLSFKVLKISHLLLLVSLFIYVCWIIMFTITCLFYHTFSERIVGTLSGCLIIFFVYIKYRF